MGTLAVTYNGTTKSYTVSGAPVVAYNGKTLLTASGWSGTKTLKCAGKFMKTDVTAGSNTLKTAGKFAKSDIVLEYTASSTVEYRTITASGTFTIPAPYNRVQFFLVGGGGGGYTTAKKNSAWGGGGGGYVNTSTVRTVEPGVTSFPIVIGAGGIAANGGSTIVTVSGGSHEAAGGCGGQGDVVYKNTYSTAYTGRPGGSGGGGGFTYYNTKTHAAGQGQSNGGSNGSDGASGAARYNSTADLTVSGGSGAGKTTIFNGVTYAGGGGGGVMQVTYGFVSQGGTGGGGAGGEARSTSYKGSGYYHVAVSGTPNTGGGGGGGAAYKDTDATSIGAGQGGSGVVIAKLWEA